MLTLQKAQCCDKEIYILYFWSEVDATVEQIILSIKTEYIATATDTCKHIISEKKSLNAKYIQHI